jgi:hypothetical protein
MQNPQRWASTSTTTTLRADTVRQVAKLMADRRDHRSEVGRAAPPRRQAPVHRDRDRRRPAPPSRDSPPGGAPAGRSGAKQSGSATPRPPRRSTPYSSSGSPTGIRPSTTAVPAATPPALSSCMRRSSSATNRMSSSSSARNATSATSTSASPSAQLPRRPRSTRSTPAAKPASPSAARKLGLIKADIAVALSLSLTHKAVGFDRRMPDVDFDALDLPATGTLPLGVPGAGREGGARNRQQPRRPSRSKGRTKRPEA